MLASVRPGTLATMAFDGAGEVFVNGSALANTADVATKKGNVGIIGANLDSLSIHLLGLVNVLLRLYFICSARLQNSNFYWQVLSLAPFSCRAGRLSQGELKHNPSISMYLDSAKVRLSTTCWDWWKVSCCRSGNVAVKAKSIGQIYHFGQGNGSATFVGEMKDIFVRLYSSGGLLAFGNSASSLPQTSMK